MTISSVHLIRGLCLCLALVGMNATAFAQSDVTSDPEAERVREMIEGGLYASAIERLEAGMDSGNTQAMAMLADMYSRGLGVPQNFERAAELNHRASEAGDYDALNALGRAHMEGLGVRQDEDLALSYLERAAQSGRAEFQADLALALEQFPDRNGEAVEWYRRASEQGHLPSKTSLGVLYLEGRGVERDVIRAMSLFAQAAEQGDARAQNNLGLIYVRGTDVERDYDQAFQLFQMAAEQGLRQGLTNLSVMYESGFGVAVDEAEARRLLTEARRVGGSSLEALLEEIGFPFDDRLVQPDWQQNLSAEDEQAALAGDPVALYRSAFRYLNGYGVRQNMSLGVAQMQEAAETGLGGAKFNMSVLYARGLAVPQNYEDAYVWASLAAYSGVDQAQILRDALAIEMSADQISRAQSQVQRLIIDSNQ